MTASGELEVDPVVGARLGGLAALLPARPAGPVLLAVSSRVAAQLRPWFPDAQVIAGEEFVPPGADLGLLVVDTRLHSADRLRAALRADGVLVTIGRRGRFVLYPDAEEPQHIWQRGWPLPEIAGARAQVRRHVGLLSSGLRGVPRVEISGPAFVSLADTVGGRLRDATGTAHRLVGIHTASRVVLRFRGEDDLAVRLGPPAASPGSVAHDVPAAAALIPTPVAQEDAGPPPWVATAWVPGRRTGLVHAWRRGRRSWADTAALVRALEGTVTGYTAPGWAQRWTAATPLVHATLRPQLEGALVLLEDAVPTGWCHGDPWPGNVLLDRDRVVVVDWDNATRDAPLGLDWLIYRALQRAGTSGGTLADGLTELVERPDLVVERVGGRRWAGWDVRRRAALAITAFLAYLRNRAVEDLGRDALERQLTLIAGLARRAGNSPAAEATDDAESTGSTGSTADEPPRGDRLRARSTVTAALWLGIGAVVVKASQTAVLLVLAALLAPSAMGTLAIGSLVLNAASAFTDLGSSTALVYWRGDAERAARSALTLALSFSLALVAGGWLLAPALSAALHGGTDGTHVIRGMLLALPFSAVAGVSRELLRRDLAFLRRVLPDIASALIGSGIALALAYGGHGVDALIACQLVQSALAMLLCWIVRRPVLPGWSRPDISGLVAYGRHLASANLLQLLMLNIDYLVVARALGSGPLGQYSLAFRLAYMPYLLIAVVIGGAAFPYLCRMSGDDVGEGAEQVGVLTLTLLAPLYVGMALLAPQLQLLGGKWAPAVPAVRWLAAYGLVISLIQVCLIPLNAVSRTRDSMTVNLVHLCLLCVALVLFVSHGVRAVAMTQTGVALLAALLALALTQRGVAGFRTTRVIAGLLPAAAATLVMAAAVLVGERLLPGAAVSFPRLLLLGLLGLAAYVAVAWGGRRSLPSLLSPRGA